MNTGPATNSRILLTGANGFVGSAVARMAVARGHKVMGLVRPASAGLLAAIPDVQYVVGTLENAPWDEIRSFKPDVCVHTAWISTPGVYLEAPENRELVQHSRLFLERALDIGIRFALVLGTCIEYAIRGEKLNEASSPIAPVSLYARSKNQLREMLEMELVPKGLNLSWGRVFYLYGVGEPREKLCSSMIAKLSRGEEIVLKTPHSIKDYIYITDLAAAILTIVEQRKAGAMNLGTGEGTSILELVQLIAKLIGTPELVRAATETAPDPYPLVVADATRLRSLGWEPKVSLEQGIRNLIEDLRAGART